jgi:FMN phosphatase YigB (HAD superfamily)
MINWVTNRLSETQSDFPLQDAEGIKFVVFDAFGTLCRIRDRRHPYGKLLRCCNDRSAARKLIMTRPLTLRDAGQHLGVHDDALIASLEADLAVELASIELYPEVVDVLHGWNERGIKIAVASNLAMPYAEPLLRLLPFPLDAYAWSFEIGYTKPAPPFYGWVIAQLGGDAVIGIHNTVLWVGDSLPNDYRGPIEYGLRAILIEREPTGLPSRHSRALMVLPELPNPRLIRGLA